ncbi:large tegument protein [Aotine betaherpesvirus 1]|uniref:Large tegument protein n=1 Tax=Aotine betaherpesvirus 1 TaxID=50290 RepID=G8XUC3_9BETA|nr:large tegument protein [Aotine betaherpesvirus 1]AEV80753.1 large tegument protein [Aotine betaherpesvirus 1]
MQIYAASCDQADRKFGPRAGSQCVCNCFMYFHVLHTRGAFETLQRATLDKILQEGAKLDAWTEKDLIRKNITPHVFRLGEEVPRIIHTDFGRTAHALSRPFNGTAETRDLDGYTCLGIFDFLLYAYNKSKPVYILVTVDALARAVAFMDNDIYVFDPHASDQCGQAAVYKCRSLDDVVTILTSFGLHLGTFYYDALIVYMINLTISPIPDSDINRTIISLFRDPDISLPPVPPISTAPAAVAATATVSTPKTVPVKPVTAPAPVPSPKPTPNRSAPARKPEKRKAEKQSDTGKKSQRKSTRQHYSCAEALPSLSRYETLVETMERDLLRTALKAPPTSGWVIYSGTSGLPFDGTFLQDRVDHLASQMIDRLAMMRYFVDPSESVVPSNAVQASIQKQLRRLWGFSETTDTFLSILMTHNLNLLRLYNAYLSRRKAPWSTLEKFLGAKTLAVFEYWGKVHGPLMRTWAQNLIRHLEKTSVSELDVKIKTYVWSHPIPVNERFVCLARVDRDHISGLVAARQSLNSEQLNKQQADQRQIAEVIARIETHQVEQLTPQNVTKSLAGIQGVDPESQLELQRQGTKRFQEICSELNEQFRKILSSKNNQILSGSLPVQELTALQTRVDKASALCQAVVNLRLCDSATQKKYRELHEHIRFVLTGDTSSDVTAYPEELTKLRRAFTDVVKHREYNETKIKELLTNVEYALKDPTSRSSNLTMSMVQAQLQELSNLDVKKVSGAEERLRAIMAIINSLKQEEEVVRAFVKSFSYHNMPSDQVLKRQLRLKDLLRSDEQLRTQYINGLGGVLNTIIEKMALQDFWKPQNFDMLREMINQLPPGKVTDSLNNTAALFTQLGKKVEAVSKAAADKNMPALEDAVRFFVIHGTSLSEIMATGIGADLMSIFEKLKKQLEGKYLQRVEEAWQKQAKELSVTSPEVVEQFLRTAPSTGAANAVTPLLQEKLKAYVEEETRKINEENQRLLTESQARVQAELARLVDALRSETPSLVAAVDLDGVQNVLSALGPNNTQTLLEKFNRDLLPVLGKIEKQLAKLADGRIYQILTGKPDAATDAYPGDLNILKAALERLRGFAPNLTQEAGTTLLTLYHRLTFITAGPSNQPAAAFAETEYESKYLQYQECLRGLAASVEDSKNAIVQEAANIRESVKKDSASSSKKALEKPPTVNRQVLTTVSYPAQDTLKNTAFQRALDEHVESAKKYVAQEADLLDAQIRSVLELQQARSHSLTARWQELVTRHKVDSLEIQTPEAKALLSDAVGALTSLVQNAATALPYLTAEKTLKWATAFLGDAIREIEQTEDHPQRNQLEAYVALVQKAEQHLVAVGTAISNNAACEKFVSQQGTTTVTEDEIQRVEAAWQDLQPKRVAGGEARHRQVQSELTRMRRSLSELELKESLATEYFELLNGIHSFSYGLDFSTQLQKLRQLQQRFTELAKQEGAAAAPATAGFPEARQTEISTSIPTAFFLKGLTALEKRVLAGYKFLGDMVSKQFLVNGKIDDVPPLIVPSRGDPSQAGADKLARLQFLKDDAQLYEVVDVFGEHQLVTPNGVPVDLGPTYGNVVFKFLALQRGDRNAASKRSARLKNTVTSRYKAVTVSVAIAGTLKTFWKQISDYDLRGLLTDDVTYSFSTETNTLINLKIFVYVVVSAWTLQTRDDIEADPGPRITLPVSDLCVMLSTLYPEYIYTVVKHPIQSSLTSLIQALDKSTVSEALNTTQNPPPWDIDELKGFCFDPKLWPAVSASRILWDNDFMRQLCQDVGPRKIKSGKLLQYALAVLILPQDVLQCLWLELRPKYAEQYVSMYDFVQALYQIFSHSYDIVRGTPATDPQWPTGEKVLQSVTLRQKGTQDDDEILKIFIETEAVLDYALGSLVFGVPICCAIHVAEVASGTRTLVARHLEYTGGDQDFKRILRSRDLNFGYLISQTWTNTPLEQCWFQSQAKKLREHLQHPVKLDFVPLVVYTPTDRYVKSVLKPPAPSSAETGRAPAIVVENPFPLIPISEAFFAPKPLQFQRVPVDTAFLQEPPPRLLETRTDDSQDADASTDTDDSAGADGARESDGAASLDSVPSHSFGDPVFRQEENADTVRSKDDVTTLSPSASTTSFRQHPATHLTHNVQRALQIIVSVRVDLRRLAQSVIETTRRLEFLYL